MRDKIPCLTLKEIYGSDYLQDLLKNKDSEVLTSGFHKKNINNPYLDGYLISANLNDIRLTYQEWKITSPFKIRVDHHTPLIKLQFELLGQSAYEGDDHQQIIIPSNHYQFIYNLTTHGFLNYSTHRKVLDIHLPYSYLEELLGSQGFSKLGVKALINKTNMTLFKSPLIISTDQELLIDQLTSHNYKADFAYDFLRCKANELILSAFVGANNALHQSPWSNQDIAILNAVRDYLKNNYQQDFHLQDLAKMFGINEYKLKNGFKALFSDTVFGYIRKMRLTVAHQMLLETPLEIKEIAYLTGFKYSHHFTKVYFDHFNKLPKESRKPIKLK
ncbi:helix-turn-helix transcriptional regulator [Sphingobacterium sp. HJSM2_6]|uniref:helix-turn-helix transcriptional regulator n=1 Tax=Sphingobacterium sp. HJSM2_6 TaxID=3366264 RepID=UPI003BCBBF07